VCRGIEKNDEKILRGTEDEEFAPQKGFERCRRNSSIFWTFSKIKYALLGL